MKMKDLLKEEMSFNERLDNVLFNVLQRHKLPREKIEQIIVDVKRMLKSTGR